MTPTRNKIFLAFSLAALLSACGTVGEGDGANTDGNGTDGRVNSTAGGYETRDPAGSPIGNGQTNPDNGGIDPRAGSNTSTAALDGGQRPLSFTINFDLDSTEITPQGIALLKEHADYLRANPGLTLIVEGHADERGSREYNIGLGQRRAEAVRRLLVLEGVRKQRVDTISFGEEKPLDFRHDQGAWAANRRAVFVYPQ